MGKKLHWKVNTCELLREIVENNNLTGVLQKPIIIFKALLAQTADRAVELDDPQLNICMLQLQLYDTPPDKLSLAIKQQEARIVK